MKEKRERRKERRRKVDAERLRVVRVNVRSNYREKKDETGGG